MIFLGFVWGSLLLSCVKKTSGLVLRDKLPPGLGWENIQTVKVHSVCTRARMHAGVLQKTHFSVCARVCPLCLRALTRVCVCLCEGICVWESVRPHLSVCMRPHVCMRLCFVPLVCMCPFAPVRVCLYATEKME